MIERFVGNLKGAFNRFMDTAMEQAYQNTLDFYEMKPGEENPQELLRRVELDEARAKEVTHESTGRISIIR